MDSVNRVVLKMINSKKYPLCPQKILRVQRNKEKYQIMKMQTCPTEASHPRLPLACINGDP
jgi:hypothetical protein